MLKSLAHDRIFQCDGEGGITWLYNHRKDVDTYMCVRVIDLPSVWNFSDGVHFFHFISYSLLWQRKM